jgi:hypothetical protein
LLSRDYLARMHGLDKEQVAATILLSNEGIEEALQSGKPSRCTVEDLHAVLAEYGQHITSTSNASKNYPTLGQWEPSELYTDIRLCVDAAPSDLVLRCTFFAEQNAGYYAYRIEDLLAP